MNFVAKGIVLREVDYKNSDKILTALLYGRGKIAMRSRRCKGLKSPLLALSNRFCFCEFSIYEKDGKYQLDGGEAIESFYPLRDDLAKMSLASYAAEVADRLCQEEVPEDGLLRLLLNTLYAAAKKEIDPRFLKACFELRAAKECGLAPELTACAKCGGAVGARFCAELGGLLCDDCAKAERVVTLNPASLSAIKYLITADPAKAFGFALAKESAAPFYEAAQQFILARLDCRPKTLDFLNGIL